MRRPSIASRFEAGQRGVGVLQVELVEDLHAFASKRRGGNAVAVDETAGKRPVIDSPDAAGRTAALQDRNAYPQLSRHAHGDISSRPERVGDVDPLASDDGQAANLRWRARTLESASHLGTHADDTSLVVPSAKDRMFDRRRSAVMTHFGSEEARADQHAGTTGSRVHGLMRADVSSAPRLCETTDARAAEGSAATSACGQGDGPPSPALPTCVAGTRETRRSCNTFPRASTLRSRGGRARRLSPPVRRRRTRARAAQSPD